MIAFFSSQEGGPGGSPPPALTLSYGKQPRIWDSGRGVPVGSMETRDAEWPSAFLAGDRAAELRICANRRRGKRLSPALQRRSGPSPPRRGRSAAWSAAAAHRRGRRARRVGRARTNGGCEKRQRQAPPPLNPAPSQPHSRELQKFRGHGGHSQGTLSLPS